MFISIPSKKYVRDSEESKRLQFTYDNVHEVVEAKNQNLFIVMDIISQRFTTNENARRWCESIMSDNHLFIDMVNKEYRHLINVRPVNSFYYHRTHRYVRPEKRYPKDLSNIHANFIKSCIDLENKFADNMATLINETDRFDTVKGETKMNRYKRLDKNAELSRVRGYARTLNKLQKWNDVYISKFKEIRTDLLKVPQLCNNTVGIIMEYL